MTKIVSGKTYVLKNENSAIQNSFQLEVGIPKKCINCIDDKASRYLGIYFEGQKNYNPVEYKSKLYRIWYFPRDILEQELEEVKTFYQEEFEI